MEMALLLIKNNTNTANFKGFENIFDFRHRVKAKKRE